jgi:hypothetical protein
MGLEVRSAKCEVRSGKWEKVNVEEGHKLSVRHVRGLEHIAPM